jgi:hypothetical protein
MKNMRVADFVRNLVTPRTPPAFPSRRAQILSYAPLRDRPSE